ncbi:unnamed protein product [Gongylonema pulchrum]|uniref:S1 motif domain-containing protein n=1 Tax=Gongylonema pulchrum TaxID=637853 RepID=A0A183DEL5_9BILA|nr:unnamed protein product [Gongylonema pulchrum]
MKSRLILTNKKSLLKIKGPIIQNYEEVSPDMTTTGYVVYMHPNGGLIIGFFGGTRGFMLAKEAQRLGSNIKIGLTIRVRVISVDAANERMLVAVADDTPDKSGIIRAQV